MKPDRSIAVAVLLAATFAARPAGAQLRFGGHMARSADAFGQVRGLGLRLSFGVPLLPIGLAVNAERFFDGCPTGECGFSGLTVDANYSLPVPVLQPWLGVGWSVREAIVAEQRTTERGLNLGVGARLTLAALEPFVDVRYELEAAPARRTVVRIGFMIH